MLEPIKKQANLLAQIAPAMRNTGPRLLLFCFLSIALTECSTRNERDPLASDDAVDKQSHWFGVEINVRYNSPRQLSLDGKLYNSKGVIFSDSTKLFANTTEMDYSVGTGNYYDKYPGYSTFFKNDNIPADTIWLSVQLKDFSKHTIGYVSIKELVSMVNDDNLSKEIEHDKNKPLVINWGGSADSLVLYRDSYALVDSVKTLSGGPYDSSSLFQSWHPNKSITLAANYFKDKKSTIYGLSLKWIKNIRGKITNPSIYGTIKATCEMSQSVTLEKIEF